MQLACPHCVDKKVQEDRIIRRGGKNTLFNILKLSQEIGEKRVCEVIWKEISMKLKLEEEISINLNKVL